MIITDLLAAMKPRKSDNLIILASPKKPLVGLKASVRSQMVKAYKGWKASGNIGDLSIKLRSSLDTAYAEAYMIGKGNNSVTKGELKWINGQKAEQFKYLDGFMSDLDAGKGVMAPLDRIDAYLSKLDSMHWSGFAAGTPDDKEINWVLTAGDNCDDCIDFADGSPYGKGELESVPGDGTTECLFNCNCFLERV